MSHLIRLVYASRSTFEAPARHQGLDPGIARILAKSRKNNARRQIVGGLLFGEGHFLQCLEGEAEAVDALYQRIAADTRHRQVTVLSRAAIGARSFGAWSMKYVPGEQHLQALLQQWGLSGFDPYRLTAEQINTAVRYMQGEADAVDTLPGDLDEPDELIERLHASPAAVPASQPVAAGTAIASDRRSGRLAWMLATIAGAAGMGYLLLR